MEFDILTIFPKLFDSYFKEALIKRAIKNKIISIETINIRDFASGIHHQVDDRPFGGGPGMVMKIEPVFKAVQFLRSKVKNKKLKTRVILFSTRGKKLDAKAARRFSKYDRLILICGRYEGVDERVAKYIADEEISIGDYVLNGGEIASLVLIETVSRFLPGFLGRYESLEELKGSYPAYTRPPKFFPKNKSGKTWTVPPVLLSGDHKKIASWRRKFSKK
ncbi:MAG: tRNA (guanosine(37)-N1)-methyltransferase TrmD [Patescibacteria group bacterium]|nr:tRNA (guanosine(37)-N1)-methyltransferase TrmD [Patescibacteria group bacterium]